MRCLASSLTAARTSRAWSPRSQACGEGRRPSCARRARGRRRSTMPGDQRDERRRRERGEAAGVGDRGPSSRRTRAGRTAGQRNGIVRGRRYARMHVTGIDWLIVGVVLLLALFGWAQGFVAGALALAGFAVGAYVGTRLGPLLLDDGRRSPWSPAFGLVGALIAGMVFALGFEGVGARLRGRVRSPAATAVDGVLGAVLTAVRRARDHVGARRAGARQRRRGAARGPALDDPAAPQHGAAAVERADRGAGAAGPVPAHRRPGGARAGADGGDRPRGGRARPPRTRW